VIVDALAPVLAVIVVGDALTLDCDGETPPPTGSPALISRPSAPPFKPDQLASIVGLLTAYSAWRAAGVSPEGCSLISMKPAPGVTATLLLRTPKTP
jgi:hypothetical protein